MDVYRTEEEQVEALKRWWQEYGRAVIIAVVLALGSLAGWKWYTTMRAEQAATASGLYDTMVEAAQGATAEQPNPDDLARFEQAAKTLVEEHGDSTYGQFARLMLAKQAAEADDYARAAELLREVVDHGADDGLVALATDRLGRALSAQGKHDEALAALAGEPPAELAWLREEARGDVLLAQGKRAEAAAAYTKALAQAPEDAPGRALLTLKSDYLAAE